MRRNETPHFKDNLAPMVFTAIILSTIMWAFSQILPSGYTGGLEETVVSATPLLTVVVVVVDLASIYVLLRLYRGD